MCARKLPTSNPVPACGALLDDLLLVAGIAPLLQADLRAKPRHELFATDASPSGAGSLHRISEERGEHVRRDLGPAPPPPAFVSTHSSAAALITPASWTEFFAYRFRKGDHINVLELVALVSLLRRLSDQGTRRQRILCCVDSRASWVWWQKADPPPGSSIMCCGSLPTCLASSLTIDLLGAIVDQPGRCALTAFLSGTMAPRPSDLARATSKSCRHFRRSRS